VVVTDGEGSPDRGVSTVLDVCLCLLLVSAAVAAVTQAPTRPPPDDEADEAATVVTTGTATVEYSLGAPPEVTSGDAPAVERVAQGRHTTLLADAVLANVSVAGRPLSRTRAPFVAGVENATTAALAGAGVTGQVVARWTPYPGAPVRGVVVAGDAPPPDATVNAARTTVPSGTRLAGDPDSFRALADALAQAVVARLFPPADVRLALAGDGPVDAVARHRYRRAAAAFPPEDQGDPDRVVAAAAEGRVAAANERLTALLAARFERDLRSRFDSPGAARRAIAIDRVTVVVRTWSA